MVLEPNLKIRSVAGAGPIETEGLAARPERCSDPSVRWWGWSTLVSAVLVGSTWLLHEVSIPVPLAVALLLPASPLAWIVGLFNATWAGWLAAGAVALFGTTVAIAPGARRGLRLLLVAAVLVVTWLAGLGAMEPIQWGERTRPIATDSARP